jgi:hypothetical protein
VIQNTNAARCLGGFFFTTVGAIPFYFVFSRGVTSLRSPDRQCTATHTLRSKNKSGPISGATV